MKPSKEEEVQVPPIWEGLETLKFQIPFPKSSNQIHGNFIPLLNTKHPVKDIVENAKNLINNTNSSTDKIC